VVEDVLAGAAGTGLPAGSTVSVLDAASVLDVVTPLRSPEPDGRYAQFWPHRHGTDAIFLALLRRDG
jgi:16S rRNA (cytosine967-C5)-methyltransferase